MCRHELLLIGRVWDFTAPVPVSTNIAGIQ